MLATWIGITALTLINIAGWVISYVKSAKNEARHMGALEQQVANLCTRTESLEGKVDKVTSLSVRVKTLEQKVEKLDEDTHERR